MISIPESTQNNKMLSGRWSKSEQDRFIKAFSMFGRNWADVQKHVKTRNVTQVRSHAQKFLGNKAKNGFEEDFETLNSEQISYQDCSLSEQIKKSQKKKTRQQSNCPQPLFSIIPQSHIIENDMKQIQKDNQAPTIQFNLPKQQDFQHYFSKVSSKSHFMMILMENLEYFGKGGNFMGLTAQFKVNI